MADYAHIVLSKEGPVTRLTLNRPERRNALTQPMMLELEDAFRRVEADVDCRVLVLRGAGGHFSAGGDLATMGETSPKPNDGAADPMVASYRRFGTALEILNTLPKPVIAVVEGAAVGGGFGMACCSDIVILHASAKFGLPEPKVGFIPSQILPFIVRRVGEGTMRDLTLTARVIDGTEAYRLGIGRHLCETTQDLERTLARTIDEVLTSEPTSLAAVKQLVLQAATVEDGELLDRAAKVIVDLLRKPQAREGIEAFLNKNKPPWAKG